MLARYYKSAAALGLSDAQRDALIRVLGELERGELVDVDRDATVDPNCIDPKDFCMRSWSTCICGHARRYAVFGDGVVGQNGPTRDLFYRTNMNAAQAAVALRDFLCGHAEAA